MENQRILDQEAKRRNLMKVFYGASQVQPQLWKMDVSIKNHETGEIILCISTELYSNLADQCGREEVAGQILKILETRPDFSCDQIPQKYE